MAPNGLPVFARLRRCRAEERQLQFVVHDDVYRKLGLDPPAPGSADTESLAEFPWKRILGLHTGIPNLSRLLREQSARIAAARAFPPASVERTGGWNDPEKYHDGRDWAWMTQGGQVEVTPAVAQLEADERTERMVSDPLTKTGTTNQLHIALDYEFTRAVRYKHALSCVVIRCLNYAELAQRLGTRAPELVIAAVRSGRVSEERIDQSVRRLLREKFVLGLFDQPFLEVDGAVATIGRADFVAEGEAAQRAAIVRLSAAESGPAALPLAGDQAVYVENIAPTAAARLGRLVDDPVV